MKKLILTALVLMAAIAGTAQTHIPPIFGGDWQTSATTS